jgi:hypothetical protein
MDGESWVGRDFVALRSYREQHSRIDARAPKALGAASTSTSQSDIRDAGRARCQQSDHLARWSRTAPTGAQQPSRAAGSNRRRSRWASATTSRPDLNARIGAARRALAHRYPRIPIVRIADRWAGGAVVRHANSLTARPLHALHRPVRRAGPTAGAGRVPGHVGGGTLHGQRTTPRLETGPTSDRESDAPGGVRKAVRMWG